MTDEKLAITAYRARVLAALEATYPDWRGKITEGEDERDGAHLAIDLGPEIGRGIVSVVNLYRHYLAGDDLDGTIATLVGSAAALLPENADQDHDWTTVRDRLRVQLWPRTARDDRFGRRDQLARIAWQGDLVLRLVIDHPDTLHPATWRHIRDWGQRAKDCFDLAVAQTRAMLAAHQPVLVYTELPGVAITVWHGEPAGYVGTRAAWPDLAMPTLPTGPRGAGTVIAPDRGFCAALVVADYADDSAYTGVRMLGALMRDRVGRPYPLFGPGLVRATPDGGYVYDPNDDPDKALAEYLALVMLEDDHDAS